MNLNELFFFKVFKCNISANNTYSKISHNMKNCYFYHISLTNPYDLNSLKEIDRRREPLSFTNFFHKLFNKLKIEEFFSLSLDTNFEYEKNLNYYIDSMPFEYFNECIYENDVCRNETEFNYHINKYKGGICRFLEINKVCNNKFCYNKHLSNDEEIKKGNENILINILKIINNNDEIDVGEGIIEFRKRLNSWKNRKVVHLQEIIELFNYILSFNNQYLSQIQQNEIKKYFNIFLKWYNEVKEKNTNLLDVNFYPNKQQKNLDINSYKEKNYAKIAKNNINSKNYQKYGIPDEIEVKEIFQLPIQSFPKYGAESSKILKNSNIFEALNINTNVCYISKYPNIKKNEIIKFVYAMLNSSNGVIIYGVHENDNIIKGISMTRKERDKFKIWFNSEFIKVLIEYENNLKYNFYDLDEANECVLVIEIKKIKSTKLLIKYPGNTCIIIKEKFFSRNKNKQNQLINEENIKELDLREYLEILRKRLMEHYSNKFKVIIN